MTTAPLRSLDQWDDNVRDRYRPNRAKDRFRQYDDATPPVFREFYRQNHENQTLDFARSKALEYGALTHGEMGMWEAMEKLDPLVDDSDPGTSLSRPDLAALRPYYEDLVAGFFPEKIRW